MNRQLLSEIVVKKDHKINDTMLQQHRVDQSTSDKSQILTIKGTEVLKSNRYSRADTMPNVETEGPEGDNIKNFVNQSDKYWKQEREMFVSSKKLSQSFQSENIDNSSCGYNSNNPINNFNSGAQNEMKVGIQDLSIDAINNNNNISQNTMNNEVNHDYSTNNYSRINNFVQYNSFIDQQLNASQQEYMKTPSRKRQSQSINNMNNKEVNKQQQYNLENILSNIDQEDYLKPFISLANNVKDLEVRKENSDNSFRQTKNDSYTTQQKSNPLNGENIFTQKRSISIDSTAANTSQQQRNNIFIKQNQNILNQQSENQNKIQNNSISIMSRDQQIRDFDQQSTFSQPIKDKSENTEAVNTNLDNTFSICDDGSSLYQKKEANRIAMINKSGFTINSQMKNNDLQFVFSYTKKQAACFPKDVKINETFLEVLELSHNRFKVFPEEINSFKNLKRLKIDNNFVRTIPSWLFANLSLQEFSISNNLVSELPTNIATQVNLIVLDISQNRITQLPSEISKLKSLQTLNITNNEFTFIPFAIRNLLDSNLREFSFDWFKYCNPPLPQKQINLDIKLLPTTNNNKSQFSSQTQNQITQINPIYSYPGNNQFPQHRNGFDVISPLKKMSQLLFRAEQSQLYEQRKNNNKNNHQHLVTRTSTDGSYTFRQFVNEMSSNGFLLNIRNFKGQTLMHIAAANEDIGVIESINQMDTTLKNTCDQNNHTPLSLSISEEKYFAAKKLLQLHADANIGGSIFGSALNIATIKGQIYLIQDIVQKQINPNLQDVDGNTCLHYIMTIFSRDVVNSGKIALLLLEAGANPNLKNNDGWNPLHLAVRRSQYAAVTFAIDYNKTVEIKRSNQKENSNKEIKSIDLKKYVAINYSKPPFKVGQQHQDNSPLEFDFSVKGGVDKWSCLHISCYNNDIKMTKILIGVKEIDFFAINKKNQTPLYLSSKGNSLSKFMRLQLKQKIFHDLQLQYNVSSSSVAAESKQSECDLESLQIKLPTDGCNSPLNTEQLTSNVKEKTGIVITETSQQSECQKEVKIKSLNNTFTRAPSQGVVSQQQPWPQQKSGFQNYPYSSNSLANQPKLPEHTALGNIIANITSPQEKTLPFHLQKKFVHPKIQSKKANTYDMINIDDEDDLENDDIGEFPSQLCDDYNMREIDENNQIKEIRKSKEGNLITINKRQPNSYKSVDHISHNNLDFENSPIALSKQKMSVVSSFNNPMSDFKNENRYSIQVQQKHPISPYTSLNINKKPAQQQQPPQLRSSFEIFTQRICKVQQKHFADEEQAEISIQQNNNRQFNEKNHLNVDGQHLNQGFSTQREQNFNRNFNNQMGRIFNSEFKQKPSETKYNSASNQFIQNSNDQITLTNQSQIHSVPNATDSQNNLESNQISTTEPNHNSSHASKISVKEQKKLSHNILRYSHDDKEGNMFCIPKLQSGENRQQIVFQTIQNMFSLFISGTISYKKSLIETVQNVADKFKQFIIILKLFTESYSQIEQFLNENSNYLPSQTNSQYPTHSLEHIKSHTILLMNDLLQSINTTPLNYRTLMRFVEDNNEEFQENLLLQRQTQEKNQQPQTARSNIHPVPLQGDSSSGSQSNQSTARSHLPITLALQSGISQQLGQLSNRSNNHLKNNSDTSNKEAKQNEAFELLPNDNFIIKEFIMSSMLKVDLQPEIDLQLLRKYQSEDQNILLQFESFQTEGYIHAKKNSPKTNYFTNQQIKQNIVQPINIPHNTLNTEQSAKDSTNSHTPIYKPPMIPKRIIPINNYHNSHNGQIQVAKNIHQMNGQTNQVRNSTDKHYVNITAPNINSNTNTDQASTLNTSNNNYYQNTSIQHSNKTNNTTLNTSFNQSINQYSQKQSSFSHKPTNPPEPTNKLQNNKSMISPNENNLYKLQNKESNSNYNGYFNNQVLQNEESFKKTNVFQPLQAASSNSQQPKKIFISTSLPQQIQNPQFGLSENNYIDTHSQNSVIRLSTNESSETFNFNENLENSFLNDEAIIANKYLNSQMNKFQKYK